MSGGSYTTGLTGGLHGRVNWRRLTGGSMDGLTGGSVAGSTGSFMVRSTGDFVAGLTGGSMAGLTGLSNIVVDLVLVSPSRPVMVNSA